MPVIQITVLETALTEELQSKFCEKFSEAATELMLEIFAKEAWEKGDKKEIERVAEICKDYTAISVLEGNVLMRGRVLNPEVFKQIIAGEIPK